MFISLTDAIKTLDTVLGITKKGSDQEAYKNLKNLDKRHLLYTDGSITKLLSSFIIEPTILVSDSLMNHDAIDDVIRLNIDLFTSFYTQAFNVLINVHRMSAQTSFDLLSSKAPSGSFGFSMESMDALELSLEEEFPTLSLEAGEGDKRKVNFGKTELDKGVKKQLLREVEVEFVLTGPENNTHTVKMNVLIKANIIYANFQYISRMISISDQSKEFTNRLDEYRAGVISLKDLIFATDLIAEYKNERFNDNKDIIGEMESRSRSSKAKLATSGALGFNKYYQMLIINEAEKIAIEKKLNGTLDKDRYKNKLLEQVNSLSVTEMNDNWDRVSIYIKDLKGNSDMSYKSITKKDSGDSMGDMLKLIMAGRSI